MDDKQANQPTGAQTPPTQGPETQPKPAKSYGKKPMWFWVLVYVIGGAAIYYVIYLLFFSGGGLY